VRHLWLGNPGDALSFCIEPDVNLYQRCALSGFCLANYPNYRIKNRGERMRTSGAEIFYCCYAILCGNFGLPDHLRTT
jgi:hypothetical protein